VEESKMANVTFNKGMEQIATKNVDFSSDDIRMLLLTSSASPDPDDDYVSDISGDEVSVTGYSRQALTSQAVTINDTDDRAEVEANKVTFSSLAIGETIGWAVLYVYNAADASALLLSAFDVGGVDTNGDDFEVWWENIDGVGNYLYLGDN
jgi:hypothetical protein